MAKRGTLTHRRTRRLAALLKVPLPFALGVMEAVWHVTAAHAPAGDLGRLPDQDLADELYWDGDAAALVAALVGAGVLEEHTQHRLVVHGWSEHADSALRHKLKRAGTVFWDGAPPFGRVQPPTDADGPASGDSVTASDHDVTPTDADRVCQDENLPALPAPATSASNQQPANDGSPPGPPAPRVGTGAGGVHQVGDKLRDGRIVLEVDGAGQPTVVSRGEGSPPKLTHEAGQAVERIVAYASTALGHRFDRQARRRLRDRLLGGETEKQILDAYRAQVATLEALEAGPTPPADREDEDLAQGLRLIGEGLVPDRRAS